MSNPYTPEGWRKRVEAEPGKAAFCVYCCPDHLHYEQTGRCADLMAEAVDPMHIPRHHGLDSVLTPWEMSPTTVEAIGRAGTPA